MTVPNPPPSSAGMQRAQSAPSFTPASAAAAATAATKPLNSSPLANSSTPANPYLPSVAKIVSPGDAPAGLNLSGRIISAVCFTPYIIGYKRRDGSSPTGSWKLSPRRGSSAQLDSLRHLSSPDSGWDHTIVGWTGEIQELPKNAAVAPGQHSQNNRTATEGAPAPANSSQPSPATPDVIPVMMSRSRSYQVPPPVPVVNGTSDRMTMKGEYGKKGDDEEREIRFDAQERQNLQTVLDEQGAQAGWGKIKAVWVGDEQKGGIPIKNMTRWRIYAEKVLWPTAHYIIPQTFSPEEGSALQEKTWWNDYVRFNNAMADAILEIYKPGDIVWVRDYHLLMLPQILRQRMGSDINIGLFVHTPWPSSEIFKILARRRELLEGMLAANMVTFQSETYKEHFVSCCKRITQYQETFDADGKITGVETFGAHCAVEAMPIGIDAAKVTAAATEPGVGEKMRIIKKLYGGRKLIVGRDRLDSVRGVIQKLRAFELFLEKYPEWQDKVVLVQITTPSSLAQSSTIEHQVSEKVSEINGAYGSIEHSPVQHYSQYLSPRDYYALLRAADLGLITSVRDGMNTTCHEYILCQVSSHGPVIVSEFTGTAESLTDAVVVNPTNTHQVADEIHRCLTMPAAEKESLHSKVYSFVTNNTAQSWNGKFLTALFRELSCGLRHPMTPLLDHAQLLTAYKNSTRRLFMFDYDGTLTPIVQDPDRAIPADRVIRTLKSLAQTPNNRVWIVSGRDKTFLGEYLGHIPELGLSAEHGCFLRQPESPDWVNLAETMDMAWQKVAADVMRYFTERTTGSFVEMKNIAVTWHYRRADPEFGAHQARACMQRLREELQGYEVEVMTGKANLEVRPRALNKGEIVRRLVRTENPDFVLCAGDDTTDEDMFRVLNEMACEVGTGEKKERKEEGAKGEREARRVKEGEAARERERERERERVFSVTVGPSSKVTSAKWHLLEPANVVDAVGVLVGSVRPEDVGAVRGIKSKA